MNIRPYSSQSCQNTMSGKSNFNFFFKILEKNEKLIFSKSADSRTDYIWMEMFPTEYNYSRANSKAQREAHMNLSSSLSQNQFLKKKSHFRNLSDLGAHRNQMEANRQRNDSSGMGGVLGGSNMSELRSPQSQKFLARNQQFGAIDKQAEQYKSLGQIDYVSDEGEQSYTGLRKAGNGPNSKNRKNRRIGDFGVPDSGRKGASASVNTTNRRDKELLNYLLLPKLGSAQNHKKINSAKSGQKNRFGARSGQGAYNKSLGAKKWAKNGYFNPKKLTGRRTKKLQENPNSSLIQRQGDERGVNGALYNSVNVSGGPGRQISGRKLPVINEVNQRARNLKITPGLRNDVKRKISNRLNFNMKANQVSGRRRPKNRFMVKRG